MKMGQSFWNSRRVLASTVVCIFALFIGVLQMRTVRRELSFGNVVELTAIAAAQDVDSKGCLKGAARRSFIALNDNTLTIQLYYVSEVIPLMCLAFLLASIHALYIFWRFYRWRSFKSMPSVENSIERKDKEEEDSNRPSSSFLHECRPYSYEILEKASDWFTKEIGRGAYGIVYEGVLLHEGVQCNVAIKMMKVHSENNDVFREEVRRINMLRHKNVIQLLGYSQEEGTNRYSSLPLLMVTPLHSSLAKHLAMEDPLARWLHWGARFKIALGVAEGLSYLHDGAPQQFIHHDIKPGNILFDKETFQAYIADFGTVRLMPRTKEKEGTESFAGSSGYADPYFRTYKERSAKVDVYSFGVLLFVLVGGAPQDVPQFVKRARTEEIIEPDFQKRLDQSYNKEEIDRFLAIAMKCTESEPEKRPTMSEVVMMMNGNIPVLSVAQDISKFSSSAVMYAHASFSGMKRFSSKYFTL